MIKYALMKSDGTYLKDLYSLTGTSNINEAWKSDSERFVKDIASYRYCKAIKIEFEPKKIEILS